MVKKAGMPLSVRKDERREGEMAVLVSVRALAKYTLTVCKSEKRFPKRDRWIITDKIIKHAIKAAVCADKANDVKVEGWNDYLERRKLQKKALRALRGLISLKQIAYETLPSVRADAVDSKTDAEAFERVKDEIDQSFSGNGYNPPIIEEQRKDPMEYWTGLCIDARSRLRKWRDSEKREQETFNLK